MNGSQRTDKSFKEHKVASVRDVAGGWEITFDDGWAFSVSAPSPVVPRVGMTARLYGEGLGYSVRGLLLDGVEVFYSSAADYEARQKVALYGKDAAEWLARWDAGDSVWSMACGGFGPGYEQALQIAAAEIVRDLLANRPDAGAWRDEAVWQADSEAVSARVFRNGRMERLGLSGCQFGAALMLAASIYKDGPAALMKQAFAAKREIQVSRRFPRFYDDERSEFEEIVERLKQRGVLPADFDAGKLEVAHA